MSSPQTCLISMLQIDNVNEGMMIGTKLNKYPFLSLGWDLFEKSQYVANGKYSVPISENRPAS